MVDPKIDIHDHSQAYCRSLGHRVPFSYCRTMNATLPCGDIFDCWKNILPVKEFVRQHYTEDEIVRFCRPSKPKLIQIHDLMIEAKNKDF